MTAIDFDTGDGLTVSWDGSLHGPPHILALINEHVAKGEPCGCDYWSQIEPSFKSDWEAYLTICGALTAIYGSEPIVRGVPENPDGYESEGVYDEAEPA